MSIFSAPRAISRETVQSIIVAKPLDKIFGKPTTETINIMTEEMTKMVPAVKTTTWGGKVIGPWHSSLTKTTTEPSEDTR